jgi:hypothetical protein
MTRVNDVKVSGNKYKFLVWMRIIQKLRNAMKIA